MLPVHFSQAASCQSIQIQPTSGQREMRATGPAEVKVFPQPQRSHSAPVMATDFQHLNHPAQVSMIWEPHLGWLKPGGLAPGPCLYLQP